MDEDPAERAPRIAGVLPKTLEAEPAGNLTREFIQRYGALPHVGSSMQAHFRTGVWSGNASDRYESDRDAARKWLAEASDPKVQDWLSDYIAVLNAEIESARIWEERGF